MEVTTAASGAEAIEMLSQLRKAGAELPIVISDVHMPEMDGFTMIEILREVEDYRDLPVLVLTSGGQLGDIRRCKQLDVCAHLVKPVKHSDLLDGVLLAIRGHSKVHRVPVDIDKFEADTDRSLKILLAEDSKPNQRLALGLLAKWGHQVEVADNGLIAVEKWKANQFDVILMDVQMPNMDGLEATKRIRELENNSGERIAIVAMTAHAMKGDKERCLAVGMDGYLTKPIRKPELFAALEGLGNDEPAVPVEQGESSSSVIDWTTALDLVGGDEGLFREVLAAAVEENQELLEQIDEAIAARDSVTAKRLAHTIKGGARAIAAEETAEIAASMEARFHDGDLEAGGQQMQDLRDAIAQLVEAVIARGYGT